MNFSNYRFSLDMQSNISQVSLPVREFDTGRKLYIGLTDGGNPYVIKEGCRAVFFARKADGNTVINDCIIEKNTQIVYELTTQTTSCAGVVDCEIRLYGSKNELLTSPRFIMVVDERVIYNDEIVMSKSESNAIDNIILSEETRVTNEQERVEAERERTANFKTIFVRYSANADGTDFTKAWSEGQDYIGVAAAKTEPTDKSGYTWILFKGDNYDLTDEDKVDIAKEVVKQFVDVSGDWQTITFKIDQATYTAKQGMSWHEWCQTDESIYDKENNLKYECGYGEDSVVGAEGLWVYKDDDYSVEVHCFELIIPNHNYYLN